MAAWRSDAAHRASASAHCGGRTASAVPPPSGTICLGGNSSEVELRSTLNRHQVELRWTPNRRRIGLNLTPDRFQLDPELTPDRPRTDPESTPDRPDTAPTSTPKATAGRPPDRPQTGSKSAPTWTQNWPQIAPLGAQRSIGGRPTMTPSGISPRDGRPGIAPGWSLARPWHCTGTRAGLLWS